MPIPPPLYIFSMSMGLTESLSVRSLLNLMPEDDEGTSSKRVFLFLQEKKRVEPKTKAAQHVSRKSNFTSHKLKLYNKKGRAKITLPFKTNNKKFIN